MSKKTFLLLFFLLNITIFYSQQQTKMKVVVDNESNIFHVIQSIQIKNTSNTVLTKLVLNDWNNAYSDKYSPLGKRFSDEFVRGFHFANESERGKTTIVTIISKEGNLDWKRLDNQPDVIEIELKNTLLPNESMNIDLKYSIKIPSASFTNFGYSNGNYNLNNCFIAVARFTENGVFVSNSNENLEDISNAVYENISIDFIIPKEYDLTTNLDFKAKFETESNKQLNYQSENISEIQLSLEKKVSFESFKNDVIEVETNLDKKRLSGIKKSIIIDKIVNYVADHLGKTEIKKIMVSQTDYDRNPFYGLNQLPTFLSPFPNETIFELQFLKAYLESYLKSSLKINRRNNGYIFDAIQVYLMMKYIEDNHPEMKMLGTLSKYKILKSYHIINVDFNEQYNYLYLLMARKNLDQPLGAPKNTFIKFNEQIAGKYKSGLSFKYLDTYLNDNSVAQSFKEFIALNKLKQTNASDFESIVKSNATKNIDWFFPNLIHSRNTIDYKFGEILKTKDSVSITIKSNTKTSVPMPLYAFKNNQIVFKKWISDVKTDTILKFDRAIVDRLVLNDGNEVPEFNLRNNYKSLRSFFSLNRPIKFSFFKDLEDAKYSQIFYVPEVGYNLYDGLLLSLNLHNKSILDKPFIFDLNPSISTKTASFTGSGGFAINQYNRDSRIYSIRYGFGATYLHYIEDAAYLKINPSVQFRIRKNNFRNNERQYISLRHVIVNKEVAPKPTENQELEPSDSPLNYSVFNVKYSYQNGEMTKGLNMNYDMQFSSSFGKIATDLSYRKLFENNYQISARLFAGSFIYKNTDTEFYNFGLDRPKDYLFDYNFYGRSEKSGFFSQQLIIAEGGFKSKFENPYANKWMTTLNVTSSIWHWIQMYGDVGLYQNKGQKITFVYDSGIHLNLVPDYFEIFLPVYSTNGFELGEKKYQEKIRFIFTISPKTLISLFTRKWF